MRRTIRFLIVVLLLLAAARSGGVSAGEEHSSKPNILVVIADQWRAEACGYAGNPDVKTPNLDHCIAHTTRLTGGTR